MTKRLPVGVKEIIEILTRFVMVGLKLIEDITGNMLKNKESRGGKI